MQIEHKPTAEEKAIIARLTAEGAMKVEHKPTAKEKAIIARLTAEGANKKSLVSKIGHAIAFPFVAIFNLVVSFFKMAFNFLFGKNKSVSTTTASTAVETATNLELAAEAQNLFHSLQFSGHYQTNLQAARVFYSHDVNALAEQAQKGNLQAQEAHDCLGGLVIVPAAVEAQALSIQDIAAISLPSSPVSNESSHPRQTNPFLPGYEAPEHTAVMPEVAHSTKTIGFLGRMRRALSLNSRPSEQTTVTTEVKSSSAPVLGSPKA